MREDRLRETIGAFRAFHDALWSGEGLEPWLEADLTMPQLKALMVICNGNGVSGRDLGCALGVGPSTVSALVDRLVERGWVRREEDADDRRIVRAIPTTEGTELVARLRTARRERLLRLLAHLDDDDLALVTRALRLLSQGAAERSARQHPGQPTCG